MIPPQVNRPVPKTHPGLMQTFAAVAPISTHWRIATCAEVECPHHMLGWTTTVDTTTGLGQRQAFYVRSDKTRRHMEESGPNGMVTFTFPAGQSCFQRHRAPLGRPPLYLVRGGDWRGNPAGIETRQHPRVALWFEEMSENLDKLVDLYRKG